MDDLADDEALVDEVEKELADVVIYSLGMASKLDIDLKQAVEEKLADALCQQSLGDATI